MTYKTNLIPCDKSSALGVGYSQGSHLRAVFCYPVIKLKTLRMNTIKLKVVLLCFIFFAVGYTVANFNTLKEKFCEPKQIQNTSLEEENTATPDSTLNATSGQLRTH